MLSLMMLLLLLLRERRDEEERETTLSFSSLLFLLLPSTTNQPTIRSIYLSLSLFYAFLGDLLGLGGVERLRPGGSTSLGPATK